MPAHSPLEVSVRWDVFNELFHHLAKRVPTVVVRYEDYVEDTDGALRACLGLAGLSFDGRPVTMSTGHGIAGNPSRFATNLAKITRDDQWVDQLGRARHLLVSAITWPMRSAYGYRSDRSAPIGPYPAHRVDEPTGRADHVD